jgi:hypothetical protein
VGQGVVLHFPQHRAQGVPQPRSRASTQRFKAYCTFPYPRDAKPFLPGEGLGGRVLYCTIQIVQYSTKDCGCPFVTQAIPSFLSPRLLPPPASRTSRRPNMTSVAVHPPETNGGIVTSWLPLTSTWPSVAECATGGIYSQMGANGALAIAYDPYYGMSIDRSLTCLPPFATAWWSQSTTTPLLTHTSLGPFVCPGGYTTATSSVVNDISTFVGCCPS